MEGNRNQMVVRFSDGELLKGYAHDFFPHRPSFHLKLLDGDRAETNIREIRLENVLAIFFVRDFAFDRSDHLETPPSEYDDDIPSAGSRRVRLRFIWGEVIEGMTYGYNPSREGFFLHPIQPPHHAWNLERVYVRREAVDSVEFP